MNASACIPPTIPPSPSAAAAPSPEDPRGLYNRLEALLAGNTASKARQNTVSRVIELYLQEKRLQRASGTYGSKAVDRMERRLGAFGKEFGDRHVGDLGQHDMLAFVAAHPEWESSHTKSDACGCVVTCFRWAVAQRLIPMCPFTRPKGIWPAMQPRIAIRPEEYRAIMAAAKRRGYGRARFAFRIAMFFLWQTGARTCEMRSLTWGDVDFQTGIASLSVHKTMHATGESRLIVLTPVVLRLLQWLPRQIYRKVSASSLIFTNSQGKAWESSRFASYFRKASKAAGIRLDLSPYSLRHGFTVQGLENGVGERQLADLLGHSSTRYVSWYGRSTRRRGDYLREVLNQVHNKTKP